jgi:hypothetical protein
VGVISLGTVSVGVIGVGCMAVGVKAYAWLSALGWSTVSVTHSAGIRSGA